MRYLPRSLVVASILGAIVTAGFAAPAAADAKTYRGKSSQGFKLRLATNDDRRVRVFSIGWRAPCGREDFRYAARSTIHGPFDRDRGGRFRDRSMVRSRLKGSIRATVVMGLRGRLVGSRSAEGTFTGRVILRKKGREIDRCRLGVVRWKAS